MIQLRLEDSQADLIRRVLQERAEQLAERIRLIPELVARKDAEISKLEEELQLKKRDLEILIGDEEQGRPGIVLVLNQQLDLFATRYPPGRSASLGRRGHPAPIAPPVMM